MKLVFIINRNRFLLSNTALISDQCDCCAAQATTFVFKVLDMLMKTKIVPAPSCVGRRFSSLQKCVEDLKIRSLI